MDRRQGAEKYLYDAFGLSSFLKLFTQTRAFADADRTMLATMFAAAVRHSCLFSPRAFHFVIISNGSEYINSYYCLSNYLTLKTTNK